MRPTRAERLFLCVALLAGCGGDPGEQPDVLAVFDGGEIRAAELDDLLRRRPPGDEAPEDWLRQRVREAALDEILLLEAEDRAIGDGEFEESWEALRQRVIVDAFVRETIPFEPAAEEDLQEYFAENRESFRRPGRREVYHLFLRREPGESDGEVAARLEVLRVRVLAGEPFPILARRFSDSQLRSRDGFLGWIHPGQLPPKLDSVVHELEEGELSEALVTESGAQMLMVTRVIDEMEPDFEQQRRVLRRRLNEVRRDEAVATFLSTTSIEGGTYVPTREELRGLMAGEDPRTWVLRVGTWTMSLGEFLGRLEETNWWRDQPHQVPRAHAFLLSIQSLERLVREAEDGGFTERPEVRAALDRARHSVLVERTRRELLRDRIEGESEELEAYFGANRMRFASPPGYRYRRLVVPSGPDNGRVMLRLEEGRSLLVAGALTVEELAGELGGEAESPRLEYGDDLARAQPALLATLARLSAGGYSPPFVFGGEILLLQLLEREEPIARPLADVRERVIEAYLVENGRRLYLELEDTLFRIRGFRVLESNLARFRSELAAPQSR